MNLKDLVSKPFLYILLDHVTKNQGKYDIFQDLRDKTQNNLLLCAFQDFILENPPSWTFPHLRSSKVRMNDLDSSITETNAKAVKEGDDVRQNSVEQTNIRLIRGVYHASLNGLPGKSKLKIWVRVLNIQFAGRKRYVR